jgi:hypothetical protein
MDAKKNMQLVRGGRGDVRACESPEEVSPEISEQDQEIFFRVIAEDLTPEQVERVVNPPRSYPREHSVLATHWHPEFVPLELIARRIEAAFPQREEELIIPTQHNVLLHWGPYAGVEVDCYSRGFNQKVQLLLHFHESRLRGENAGVLRSMLAHTFQYRSSQLFDFLATLTRPHAERLDEAARETGADAALVEFVRAYALKIEKLLEQHHDRIPPDAIKNKLVRNFFDTLRPRYGDGIINKAQAFLKAVKQLVKEGFSLGYFYRTTEIIEETRALGGCVVVPHPEQFWPILLADYDVDGFEVWNPQSQRYTEFLIGVVNRKNAAQSALRPSARRFLVFMGDDTHMGEKVKEPEYQDGLKAEREVGLQPAWDDLSIGKQLILAGMDKAGIIREYKNRLDG